VTRPRIGLLVAALATALLGAACAPAEEDAAAPSQTTSASAQECSPGALETQTPGTLTIATDQPVFEPWFLDDNPSNGSGFEGAVAYAVAERLGYAKDDVAWIRVPFNAAIAPGPKEFDFDINEFSITPERREAVDFSTGYYDVTQAVIALEGSPASGAASLADLKSVRIGAQVGTTSFTAVESVIAPTTEAAVFNTNDDAKQALANGQVDAIVVDLPTAFYITGAELENGLIVGQLPPAASTPVEQFGLVLDKGSPLTACVSAAVDGLRAEGTLDELAQEWLSQTAGAPVLE
jgi:polar amino acid transport system substrate-binding protein